MIRAPLRHVAQATRSLRTASLLRASLVGLSQQVIPRPGLCWASTPSFRHLSTVADYASPVFAPLDTFADRHIGPDAGEAAKMLHKLGYESMDAFVEATVPKHIRIAATTVSEESIPALTESELLARARQVASANQVFRSYIGMGYHNAVVPPVILRNVCRTIACQTTS